MISVIIINGKINLNRLFNDLLELKYKMIIKQWLNEINYWNGVQHAIARIYSSDEWELLYWWDSRKTSTVAVRDTRQVSSSTM